MAKAAKTLPPQDPLTAGRRALHKRRNAAQDRRDALSLLGRVVVLAAAAWVLFTQVFLLTQAKGSSMFPAVKDGDLLICYRLQKTYAKNDVVVYTQGGKPMLAALGHVAQRGFVVCLVVWAALYFGLRGRELPLYRPGRVLAGGIVAGAAVLTLLALSACGAQSKLVLATTGMEPTLDLTLPDTITLPDKGRDTVYKSYVDKAYSMALAAALLDMDADTMQTQLAGRLSYDAQTGYIQYYTPTEELTRGDLSEFPTDAQLEQTVRERLQKFEPELADTSRIVFSSATYETHVSSKTVDVTPEVNGRMVYGKYHISVSFDRDGNVTALTQQYAPLKMGGTRTVRLADAKTVQARLDAHDFSANIAQELTDCTITGVEQAYYMNAGFNAEGDYALYPIYVLRGQGTAADGSVQNFEVLVSALAG